MKCPVCGRTDVELDICPGCDQEMCEYCIEECECLDGDDDDDIIIDFE